MSLKQLKISYLFLVNVYVFKKVVWMSCAIVPVQIKNKYSTSITVNKYPK